MEGGPRVLGGGEGGLGGGWGSNPFSSPPPPPSGMAPGMGALDRPTGAGDGPFWHHLGMSQGTPQRDP